ncbi:MAG: histidine kinase, partial [Duncaniella sp.]|nr:histidine kinase [Duncaniella sp.]
RYPSDKVAITSDFPDRLHTTGVMVPPLIFLVFIENAFKHGITYREESYVSISIRVADGNVEFHCLNSNHPSAAPHTPGIGLANVKQRLNLIYGSGHSLETIASDSSYNVNLIIPVHETPDSNN